MIRKPFISEGAPVALLSLLLAGFFAVSMPPPMTGRCSLAT
ncbi:MAG: hypothetical protein ACRD9R_10665 [Pyrinomonadaceae bacterium]